MLKGDEVFPGAMQRGFLAEPVVVEVRVFLGSGAFYPKRNPAIQFANVAERWTIDSFQTVEVVELLSHFFGRIAAAFFVPDKPERGLPGSVAIEVGYPMLKRFLVDNH